METIELWPFSQGELETGQDRFVDLVFDQDAVSRIAVRGSDRADVVERICRGGYPAAVARRDPRRRRSLITSYVRDLIDRDIRELEDIGRMADVWSLLQLLAARSCQLLNIDRLANELNVTWRTADKYLDLCEEVFLVKRIPAWSRNPGKRVVSAPKVALVDSGVAATLLGQDPARLTELTSGMIGPLLEGFAVMELARQLTWSQEEVRLFHYRTKDKVDVDAVLETNDGRVVGVEVKASSTVTNADFRGLRNLATAAGDTFVNGIVLYTGHDTISFGPRLKALPISALWLA